MIDARIGIYKITSPTGKVYIGQSCNLPYRYKQYKWLHCKAQTKLYHSLLKYGFENHQFEVLIELKDNPTQQWLDYLELFFYNYFKQLGELLNIRCPGSSINKEQREKLAASLKGKHLSEEHKHRISLTSKGRVQSEDTKRKRGLYAKGGDHPNSKTVIQLDINNQIIHEWPSVREASKNTKVNKVCISNVCRHKQQTAGGYKWEYSCR